MIAVDTNILVYSHRSDSPFHDRAVQVVRQLVEGGTRWALPWPCIHEFVANVTNARIYKAPTPLDLALEQASQWLGSPAVRLLSEEEGYWDSLAALLQSSQVSGAKVHDARIAALCIAHGVAELWTADRDFNRFAPLRTANPLVEGSER
ncbi:MAG: PIN domain-containing protein [Myxococcales bacterium]|nr:PIN domain-containing protein [Myxococcales bacterium]